MFQKAVFLYIVARLTLVFGELSNDPLHTVGYNRGVFNLPLNSDGYKLFWSPNYETKSVKFEIHLTPSLNKGDWFALGFSNYGEHTMADYCFVQQGGNGRHSIQVSS